MIFGANPHLLIREMRKRAGLSQQALAERVEVSQRSLSDYETGKSYPTLDAFDRICVACGVGSLGELQQEIDRQAGNATPGGQAYIGKLPTTPTVLRLMADMQEQLDRLESEVKKGNSDD